jgi:putative zinc finger/helix-turn-helix YgiT family protein
MTTINTDYCVICGDDREFRHERKPTEFEVRGETLKFDVPVKVCPNCGTVEEEEAVDPAEIAFGEYRKRKGLLTPEEIKSIRKRFRLSQKSLAVLLGMSEATVNR